jgi:epoxyqueuosine reductase
MDLTDALKSRARELGFCAVGVTGAERFSEAETAAVDRTQQGLMDGLSWWSEARAHASADPQRATPNARSVIALAFPHPLAPNAPSPARGGGQGGGAARGRVAAYALGRDYHEVLLERMQPLLTMLRDQGHVAKTYLDHGWMLDRAVAARAGLGWLGKNTNLLIPGVGSSVLLAEIVTSAELEPDEPLKKTCGGCDACMRVCPTGALIQPGVLDNQRCISFWTIEHRGVIPLDIRPLIGDWIFGCDLCQEICPVNVSPRAAAPDTEALEAFGPTIDARPQLKNCWS